MKKLIISVVAILAMSSNVFATQYNDVDKEAWYSENIQYVTNKGIMSGTTEGNFEPDTYMTRSMFVSILYRLTDNKSVDTEVSFIDVDKDSWYYEPLRWAYSRAIIFGEDDLTFGPEEAITREQMITLLYRFVRNDSYDIVSMVEINDLKIKNFEDFDEISSDEAVKAVEWAYLSGLVQGNENMILPKSKITRAEVAAIMERFDKEYGS